MSDKPKKDQHISGPDYGSSSGFSGDVPQSGMVQDDKDAPVPPPTGGGTENGSPAPGTPAAKPDDENANTSR